MFGQLAQVAMSMTSGIHNPFHGTLFPLFVGWIEFLVPLIPWVASLLFGSGSEKSQTTTTETPFKGWQSPLMGAMDPTIWSGLIGNAQALGGAGMPGGKSRWGQGTNDMFANILSLIKNEWPQVMSEYKKKSVTPLEKWQAGRGLPQG